MLLTIHGERHMMKTETYIEGLTSIEYILHLQIPYTRVLHISHTRVTFPNFHLGVQKKEKNNTTPNIKPARSTKRIKLLIPTGLHTWFTNSSTTSLQFYSSNTRCPTARMQYASAVPVVSIHHCENPAVVGIFLSWDLLGIDALPVARVAPSIVEALVDESWYLKWNNKEITKKIERTYTKH